jgi:hypothetical protein
MRPPTYLHEKSRVQPKETLITSAKRLLQQNLPQPDSCTPQQTASLFDHLVGDGEQRRRDSEAERSGSLHVDAQYELGRKLDGQIGRLGALQVAPITLPRSPGEFIFRQ